VHAAVATLFAATDRELWLLTSRSGERRGGLIATFVSQASIVPELPRVVVGVARHHHTWGLIEASGAFALHLFGEDRLDWVWHFGVQTGHEVDKFAGLTCTTAVTGSPLLADALGWLDCRVEASLDTGDRSLSLAEVGDAGQTRTGRPLTVRRLLQLVSPDKLALLKAQMERDSATDADAIRAWRQCRRDPAGS
jgi:flavin reductase (DIM6/NTAB) family NADH-FMN oxidoreductase RutF